MKGILAFGDSVMKGTIIENGHYRTAEKPFTDIVSSEFQIPVLNKSHFGHTLMKGLVVIDRSAELLKDPDYDTVLLEFGGNDSDFNWKEIVAAPEIFHSCNTRLSLFEAEYAALISRMQLAGKRMILLSLPPVSGQLYLQRLSSLLDGDAICCWLSNDPLFLERWHEQYNIAVFRIATECRVPLIDITSPFLKQKNMEQLLCEDGIHPNEAGHKLIADTIIDYFEKYKL